MARYILKRKSFTKWDDTDNLKRMKDSDILAEEKKLVLPEVLVALERKVLESQPPDQELQILVN